MSKKRNIPMILMMLIFTMCGAGLTYWAIADSELTFMVAFTVPMTLFTLCGFIFQITGMEN